MYGFQVSYGLHELLRNNAANIHSAEDWAVIFSLLEVTVFYPIGSRYIQLPILWSYKLSTRISSKSFGLGGYRTVFIIYVPTGIDLDTTRI